MLSKSTDKETCRLCLTEKGNFIPVFSDDHLEPSLTSLLEKISLCTEVQIHRGDGLPQFICHHCLYQIEIWFSFKQLCLRTNSFLQKEAQKSICLVMDDCTNASKSIAEAISSPHLNKEESKSIENKIKPISSNSDCHQFVSSLRVYSRQKKICCDSCDAKFTNSEDLESHKANAHCINTIEQEVQILRDSEDQASFHMLQSVGDALCDNSMYQDNQEVPHSDSEEQLNILAPSTSSEVMEAAAILVNAASFNSAEKCSSKVKSSKIMRHLNSKYKKANLYPCPFCGTYIQRISRHIETQHSNESDVKRLMSLEKKSVERHRLLEDLRIQGIVKYDKTLKEVRKKTFNQSDHRKKTLC